MVRFIWLTILCLFFTTGCANIPDDVVLQDDSRLIEFAIADIRLMEEKFDKDLIDKISSSNNPRYFKGNYPHKKVIAIELVPPGALGPNSGRSQHRKLLNNRCLIKIEEDALRPNIITHEILHCLSAKHTSYGIMYYIAPLEKDYEIHLDTYEQIGLEKPEK